MLCKSLVLVYAGLSLRAGQEGSTSEPWNGDSFGGHLVSVSDVNGDSVPDLAVADELHNEGEGREGAVWLLSGADGSVLWAIAGKCQECQLGRQLVGLENVNGAGFDELAVLGWKERDQLVVLSTKDGRPRAEKLLDSSIVSLAGTSDIDGDAVPDLLVASIRAGAGRVQILSGRTLELIREASEGLPTPMIGTSLAAIGDVDRDGVPDFVVAGGERVCAFSGADAHALFDIRAPEGRIGFGRRVWSAGDVDQDSFCDIAVSSQGPIPADPTRQQTSGAHLTIFSGQTGKEIYTLSGGIAGAFGFSFAVLGDYDGDGIEEIAVGAGEAAFAGDLFVYSGASGKLLARLESDSRRAMGFGSVICPIGDIDQDGLLDFAVGCTRVDIRGNGLVQVRSGKGGGLLREYAKQDLVEAR